uniref:Putative secreted mucin n=1 Tax=Amblyomma triste TaxID=251400 RepID=A0A023GAH6_AMBTT
MALPCLTAVIWLLVATFIDVSTGQNVSATMPPVYNTKQTDSGATAAVFNVSSSVSEPSTAFRTVMKLPVLPTERMRAAQTPATPAVEPVTNTQPEITLGPQGPAFAKTFVLPEVNGLVEGELRSSMNSAATTSEDRTVRLTTPALNTVVTANKSVDSTLAVLASEAPVTLGEPDSTSKVASTLATGSNSVSGTDDLSFVSSLFPELDLSDNYGSSSTDGVSLPTSTPSVDVPTMQPPSVYNMSKERYCIAARFCYKELNERCVMRHMKSVCGCGRAFFRNPATLVCERKLPLLVSLELPEHSYVQEVADKKSLEFKAYESAAHHLVREEAEPLAFPPLASYEPGDQAFLKFYNTEPSVSDHTEATATIALSSLAS